MTKDQQGLIFDQFRQASNEIRRKYGGSGLGLSISKKLVAAMSGTLTVESELDRGSTFTMWLPDNIDPGDQPRAHPLVSTVLLYEAPILADNTSKTFLSSGIKAAGRDVHHVWEAELLESAFDKFSPDTIVVATRPNSRDSALDDVLSFLRTVLDRNPALLVIGIDKSLSKWDVSGNFKAKQICRLPLFPTSNEFKEAFDTRRLKESPTLAKHIEEVASNCRMNPLRVLVAEDIVINQKVIVKLLSRLPCTVDIANDGAEAVELAGMHKYDLILMDCVMPVVDGLEATRIIRRRDKTTPIVALTANATTDDRRTCLQAGCSDFMPKPVSFDLLCTIFAKISKNSATAVAAAAENGDVENPFRQEQKQQMNHVSTT
jgi:two-component system, sensor histidine kinase and response regulator